MNATGDPALARLVRSLRGLRLGSPRVAFVLGSGLGGVARRLSDARRFPCEAIDGMPCSIVPGHAGVLVAGELCGVPVLVQQGRVHRYEGRSASEVARSVRAFAVLGCEALVLTNAAGGLVPEWRPGTWMRIEDHLNLQGEGPLTAGEAGHGRPYDPELGRALELGARQAGMGLERGVYAGLPGPAYETPAEVRLLRALGAHAVGMSTVAEALAGHASGMRVAAVSLISNHAAGLVDRPLSHEEVLEAGRAAGEPLAALLEASVAHLLAVLEAPGGGSALPLQ